MDLLERLAVDPLTPRERQVLEGIVDGLTNHEIALALGVKTETVQKHYVCQVLSKLDARNRTDAAVIAISAGLLPPRRNYG